MKMINNALLLQCRGWEESFTDKTRFCIVAGSRPETQSQGHAQHSKNIITCIDVTAEVYNVDGAMTISAAQTQ
jgi:hypothetical protein